MTLDKEKIIASLVNKGLDGDMDAVNAHDDKMIRAKAKAMIIKVKKGTLERPPLPNATPEAPVSSDNLSKDDIISLLVNKGLDGDMDAVNAHDDKMIRAKAKAMIIKVKKGKLERPPLPNTASNKSSEQETLNTVEEETLEKIGPKIKKYLVEKFPGSLIENSLDGIIQIGREHWFEIAQYLKSDSELLFDSLQCQMGIDLGEDNLESRYNLHSLQHNHYIEIRIQVTRADARIPSVEQIWRIADWFERETYDMFGIEYTGHRDLRRILLPDDWEGWPLRKDYQEQETYHGIMVPKIKEGWD